MKRVLPLIEIEWLDANSAQHHTAWTPFDEYHDTKAECCLTCVSVGYIVREEPDRLVIAAHLSLNHDDDDPRISECSGTFIIPKCCIVSERRIK